MDNLKKGEASKQLECATNMPALRHKIRNDGENNKFNIEDSEVAKWLLQQPDVMQYVFTRIKNSGFIVYDPESKLWCGRNNYTGQKQYNGLTIDEIYSRYSENETMTLLAFAEHMGMSTGKAKTEIKLQGSFWIDGNDIGKKK